MTTNRKNRVALLLLEQLWKQAEDKAGSPDAFSKSEFMGEVRRALPKIKDATTEDEKRELIGWLALRR